MRADLNREEAMKIQEMGREKTGQGKIRSTESSSEVWWPLHHNNLGPPHLNNRVFGGSWAAFYVLLFFIFLRCILNTFLGILGNFQSLRAYGSRNVYVTQLGEGDTAEPGWFLFLWQCEIKVGTFLVLWALSSGWKSASYAVSVRSPGNFSGEWLHGKSSRGVPFPLGIRYTPLTQRSYKIYSGHVCYIINHRWSKIEGIY